MDKVKRAKEIQENIDTMRDNIKRLRIQNQISQKSLAKAMYISQNAYSKMELGYSPLQIEKVLFLCEFFKVDISVLLVKQ